MFLTQLHLNPQRRGARRLLSSPRRMHAMVEGSLAPSQRKSDQSRTLWRVDQHSHRTTLYVVSVGCPDLSAIVEEAGWPATETWRTANYQPLLDRLSTGQRYGFRLTANPVKQLAAGPGKRGKRVAHVTPVQQVGWLHDRAAGWGFEVVTDPTSPEAPTVTRRGHQRFVHEDQRHVTQAHATFEGVLTVTNPPDLVTALTTGMGRSRAYGCGLMTLAHLAQ